MRIGIFAGSFDPVHKGHVTFALDAIKKAKLDKVYFLPEHQPRHKKGITHYAHRLAMIKIATSKQSNLDVLDLPDRQFTVAKTMARLNQKFVDDELCMLVGTDVLEHLGEWPLVDRLLERADLIVGRRQGSKLKKIDSVLDQLPISKNRTKVIHSATSVISAVKIRENIRANKKSANIDPAVYRYIKDNWLYVSV